MSIHIYRQRGTKRDWKRIRDRFIETSAKVTILLMYPLPEGIMAGSFWYFVVYRFHLHFSGESEVIALHGWLPLTGLFYSFLTIEVIRSTWDEYKEIRRAIKCYDKVTFMHLRDEDVSPLMHALIVVFGLMILGGFMSLDYTQPLTGTASSAAAAYLLALITHIIIEIDNPFVGVWFIKHVPEEWMEEDVYEFRDKYREIVQAKLCQEGLAVVTAKVAAFAAEV